MSVVHGSMRAASPSSFAVLAGRMAHGDDHKSGLVGVITFDQGKRSFCEQTFAWLVLNSTLSAPTGLPTENSSLIGKNRAGHYHRDLQDRVSLL